jgi:flagellar motility protein MotE (MotC chaperone)
VRLTRLAQASALLAAVKLAAIACLWLAPQTPAEPVLQPIILRQALAAKADQPANATESNATSPAPAAPEAPNATAQEQRTRQADLDKREADLRTLERELGAKLENLKALEAKMQKMIDEADAIRDQKIAHLIDVYSNMKPKQAAQVLSTLEESIAVKILAGMSGRKAGEILSSVDAVKAARLTESLTKLQIGEDGK